MGNSKAIRQQAKKHGARGRAKQIPRKALTLDAKIGQKVSDAFDNFDPEEIDEEAQQYMRVPEATTVNRVILTKYEEVKHDQDAAVAEAGVAAGESNAEENENSRTYDDNVQTSSGWISRDSRTEAKAALIERTTNGSAASEGSSIPTAASSSNSTDMAKSEKHQVAD